MKIIAHTKHGVFTSVERTVTEEEFLKVSEFLADIAERGTRFSLDTAEGEIFFSGNMIKDSLFILQK